MTHDELLAKITQQKNNAFEGFVFSDAFDALRAVVELHKPVADIDKTVCGECASLIDPWGENCYPCPTIQAIEKELK